MTCSCPKCNAQVEFDPEKISSDGLFNNCPACSAKFLIRKRSFARRAISKGDEISCAECGNHPGRSIYCQSCHAIYPDFLVIESTSAAKRRIEKLVASFNALKNLKLGGAPKTYQGSFGASPATAGKSRGFRLPSNPVLLAAVIAVLIVIPAGAGYYWYQNKIETAYTEDYVRALSGIKAARDYEIKISNRLVSDMKIGGSSSLTPDEQKSAASAKSDVNTLVQRIGKVPDKFIASNDALAKLNDSYSKLHSAVTSPAGTSEVYSASVKKLDDDFKRSASELKTKLPEKISAQLAESSKKYKPLQDF